MNHQGARHVGVTHSHMYAMFDGTPRFAHALEARRKFQRASPLGAEMKKAGAQKRFCLAKSALFWEGVLPCVC